jgi:multidrug resistance efflux pump
MNTTRRPRRFFWLFGLLLLVGTAVSAGWLLNNAPAGTPPSRDAEREALRPGLEEIICLGKVDVERGLTPLYPLQPGRVVEVFVEEGARVKKGARLFRMDDTLARAQLAEAEASLRAAQAALAKVKHTQSTHGDQVKQQEAAVKAADLSAKALGYAAERAKALTQGKYPSLRLEDYKAAQEHAAAAKARVEVERAKLRSLEKYDYQPDLDQAEENIKAKEAALSQAKELLSECLVTAPEDGLVLRLQVSRGQVLGREPTQPAIQFCPDDPRIIRVEVQQEWAPVEAGQAALIENDVRVSPTWKGKVVRVSDYYAPRRMKIHEPFQYNDVLTLECIVTITDKSPPPLPIGQRMRVRIKRKGQ